MREAARKGCCESDKFARPMSTAWCLNRIQRNDFQTKKREVVRCPHPVVRSPQPEKDSSGDCATECETYAKLQCHQFLASHDGGNWHLGLVYHFEVGRNAARAVRDDYALAVAAEDFVVSRLGRILRDLKLRVLGISCRGRRGRAV